MMYQGSAFRYLAGNTWTTNHCSDDVDLDAGGSVTGVVTSPALLREIRARQNNQPKKEGIKLICICMYVCILPSDGHQLILPQPQTSV